MKTSCLFAAFSLGLSVSAAVLQGNNNNNGNKGSKVILFFKCRCLNLTVFKKERCLQL
jgi:hypothetical protein